jgi:hypothetical protein
VTEKKKFTIREFIDAMAENGYEHNHRGWFGKEVQKDGDRYSGYFDAPITAGCILAQAAMNLGVDYTQIASAVASATDGTKVSVEAYRYGQRYVDTIGIASAIMTLNDTPTRSRHSRAYSTILKKAKEWLEPFADRECTALPAEYNAIKKDAVKK